MKGGGKVRISRVNRYRVTGLKNPTYSKGSSATDKVNRVTGVENKEDHGLNFELDKEQFYDKLQRHRDDKKEYGEEEKKPDEKYTFSREEIEMINTLRSVLSNFNKKIDTIKKIDMARNSAKFEEVKLCISSHTNFLQSVGINLDKLYHFSIVPEVFAKSVLESPNKLTLLTDPITGTLRKITDCLTIV